jgi:hypothetical protein
MVLIMEDFPGMSIGSNSSASINSQTLYCAMDQTYRLYCEVSIWGGFGGRYLIAEGIRSFCG